MSLKVISLSNSRQTHQPDKSIKINKFGSWHSTKLNTDYKYSIYFDFLNYLQKCTEQLFSLIKDIDVFLMEHFAKLMREG